jgi:hypothetical protein
LGRETWERTFGTHQTLLKALWEAIDFKPGDFMSVGMRPNRAAWLDRVLERLG